MPTLAPIRRPRDADGPARAGTPYGGPAPYDPGAANRVRDDMPAGGPVPRDADSDGVIREGKADEGPAPGRDFADTAVVRKSAYDNVLAAARGLPPLTSGKFTLALRNPAYDGPGEYTPADEKRAILEGRSLGRRLRGTWVLSDDTGAELGTRTATIATVPYLTPRGTFIRDGTEYTLANQLRLRPGVYARVRENGELEAHVNVMPGQGRSHRIAMDPETGVFKIRVGQSDVPLLPLLRALGVTDPELRAAWGNDLAYANMLKDAPHVIDKLHARLVRDPEQTEPGGRAAALAAAYSGMPLDPDVTQTTLGRPFDATSKDMLLAVTSKLLAINRGEAEPDDRDHLAFMTVHGPEDLMAERLGRDKMALRRHLWKAIRTGTIDHIPAGVLTRSVDDAILKSGLGQPLEATNPLQVFDQRGRVSRLGVGGIPSTDSIPDESRDVQPSQFGFIDFLATPESLAAGVDNRTARGTRKGPDGRLYARFRNVRTGRTEWRTPADLAAKIVTFPGALAPTAAEPAGPAFVDAIDRGRMRTVPRGEVDYELPVMEDALSPATNLVPMKSAAKPQRAAMAARMLTQALPLRDPEAPLVRAALPAGGGSFDAHYGEALGAVKSPADGVVERVGADRITLRGADGKKRNVDLYVALPGNRKTGLTQTAVVGPGDRVRAGDLLARSNYTDGQGVAALGKNARVGYLAYKGYNFEDAIVVSEAFAKRMSSDHLYQHHLEKGDGTTVGRSAYVAVFPDRYSRATLARFDDDGVVTPGTVVQQGDPLVLAIRKRERNYGTLHAGRKASYVDGSETWEHHAEGVVTDVAKTPKGVLVTVQAYDPLKVGDKLSGRIGDKGVVAAIVEDDDMPQDAQGRPLEVLLNPLGVISRTNPAQVVEAALGKIAAVTGKPYDVEDFHDVADMTRFAMAELQKHGMTDLEEVTDPVRQAKIKDPFTGRDPLVGNRYIMKLTHTAESKAQGRATAAYSADETPAKGGETGSKRVSLMDVNALLSHGATAVIRDAGVIRGQSQPEYWAQVMAGHDPPPPKVPLIHQKFLDTLRAAGINPVRNGPRTHLMALTDKDVDALAGDRDLVNADTVDWKGGMKPVRGGLFDPTLTGGHGAGRWAAIKLAEPMPNPAMEEPARRMLGLTAKGFRDVLAGRESLPRFGRGPAALAKALKTLDVDKELDRARHEVETTKGNSRDDAVRRLGYLKAAKAHGLAPGDWVLNRVPVLPPAFRPVSAMAGGKLPLIADANLLYRELFDANKNLAELSGQVDDLAEEREAVYDAFRGVVGLGDPVAPKNRERQAKGALRHIFGDAPKFGMVQRKLIGSTVDLVGRAAISPDPDLDMDEVGLPEDRAWDVYRPFVVRRLVRGGMPRLRAATAVREREPSARTALLAEMDERPVIVNRAPTLHRYNMMAFRPRLTAGDVLRVPPLITKGFNADFDGDAMTFHVPGSADAVQEAYDKMLPSRNLLAAANFKAHQLPGQEYLGGLYTASSVKAKPNRRPRTFASTRDVVRAYNRGEIDIDELVDVLGD